jgi:hypothetical protein
MSRLIFLVTASLKFLMIGIISVPHCKNNNISIKQKDKVNYSSCITCMQYRLCHNNKSYLLYILFICRVLSNGTSFPADNGNARALPRRGSRPVQQQCYRPYTANEK